MPKTYKKHKEIDIYDLAEMTGQSVEELAEGFREAEEDIRCGRVGDAFELLEEMKNNMGLYK
ncbi:MAG: hypothetical protein IKI57_01955 [Clostridia bacterium]|nr:hypothetical protein [Clostridia bacterium]